MLLSAVLQVIIFPLPGVYILSWFALAPLLVALLRARPAGELEVAGSVRLQPASPWQGFLLGYVCGILCFAGTCYWIFDTMRHFGGLSTPMAALALFLFCCYLGLYHGLFGLFISLLASPPRLSTRLGAGSICLGRSGTGAHAGYGISMELLLGISQVDNIALIPHRGLDRRVRHLV